MVYEEVANSSAPKLANLPAPLTQGGSLERQRARPVGEAGECLAGE